MAKKVKRANGEGSISFDASRNRYRASFIDPMGKRIAKRFKTHGETVAWLTEAKADVFKGTYIAPSEITVGDWVFEYIETYNASTLKPRSLNTKISTAKHLLPIADVPLQQLTSTQVQKLFNDLPEHLGNSTKKKIFELLNEVLNKAVVLDMVRKNIMTELQKVSYSPPPPEIFSEEELGKLFNFLEHSEYYNSYFTFIELALKTGARLGELLGLKNKVIKDGYIVIENNLQYYDGAKHDQTNKTDASRRRVYLPQDMLDRLKAINDGTVFGGDDDYIFHTRDGKAKSPYNIERAWRKILQGAGIPHKKFHCLRHTHASYLIAADGVSVQEVATRLGHTNASVTLKYYAQSIDTRQKEIANKINKIFG